jgi:hypothetical protein|nr:MAG TPA: movement protein [Herelleviridae sp.]
MKKTKLYIPIFTKEGKIGTSVVCANDIKELEEIMPDGEILSLHLQAERMKMEENSEYVPQPMKLMMDKDKFASIMKEVRRKAPHNPLTHLALKVQGSMDSLPICLIFPSK